MSKFDERVVELVDVGGVTTLFSLKGAVSGHVAFDSVFSSGQLVVYGLINPATSPPEWELGVNTLTSGAPDTIARSDANVLRSSNSNNRVDFTAATNLQIFNPTSGSILAGMLNTHISSTEPLWLEDGVMWLDTTLSTLYRLKQRVSGVWVTLLSINTTGGFVSNLGVDLTLDSDGFLGFKQADPQNVLDLGTPTNARGIVWGIGAGSVHNSIVSAWSSADLLLLNALQQLPSEAVDLVKYGSTATYAASMIRFDRSTGRMKFFSEASAVHTRGDAFDEVANLIWEWGFDGMRMGGPTGGLKGAGTINIANGVYHSNILLTGKEPLATEILSGITEIATAVEVLAGTDVFRYLTSKRFADNITLAANGFAKLPGGWTAQWGTTATVAAATVTVTLPTTYGTSHFAVIGTEFSTLFSDISVVKVSNLTVSSFDIRRVNAGSSTAPCFFISIGRE